jgi:hypothetical protein
MISIGEDVFATARDADTSNETFVVRGTFDDFADVRVTART